MTLVSSSSFSSPPYVVEVDDNVLLSGEGEGISLSSPGEEESLRLDDEEAAASKGGTIGR